MTLFSWNRVLQGLFLAPSIVGESIKGAELQAHVFGTELGYECNPGPGRKRTDIVQAIKLGDRKKVCLLVAGPTIQLVTLFCVVYLTVFCCVAHRVL